MLLTPTSFQYFDSVNELEFNQDQEASVSVKGRSVFPENYLKDNGERYFNESCAAIAADALSPLCQDMLSNDCNKPSAHNYTQLYHRLLAPFRDKKLDLIEIGIGTPNQDVPSSMAVNYPFGASLRGWRTYFTDLAMTINGGDVDPRVLFSEERIKTHYVNQLNPSSIVDFMAGVGLEQSGMDFMLDDGLHQYRSNITLLITAWPYLKKGGLYLIEDMTQTPFQQNIELIKSLALNADGLAVELPSKKKNDNRIIALQKR